MKKALLTFILLFFLISLQAGGITLTDAEDIKLGEGETRVYMQTPQKEPAPQTQPQTRPQVQAAINFNKIKFGMGGGLGLNFTWVEDFESSQWKMPTKILFPIQIYKHFRLEPFFTFSLSHYEDPGDGVYDTKRYSNSFEFLVGSGIFYTHPFKSAMLIVGARLAGGTAVYVSHRDNNDDGSYDRDDKRNWSYRPYFMIEPVIGADYFLSDHFSIGGEVTLGMTYYGKNRSKNDDDDDWRDNPTSFYLHTTGTLYFRWYFF